MILDERTQGGGRLGGFLLIVALATVAAAAVGLEAINAAPDAAPDLQTRVGFAAAFGAAAALAAGAAARVLRIALGRVPAERESDHDDRA